jgi:Co/Zn/Cd efflux system component
LQVGRVVRWWTTFGTGVVMALAGTINAMVLAVIAMVVLIMVSPSSYPI